MESARSIAVKALMRQEKSGYANLVLDKVLEGYSGAPRDRAFAAAVFYGTVERQLTLDFILSQFLQKPLEKADAAVRAVLRSGLYQARYMDSVPVSAAVNEAVALTRQMGKGSAAGLVNAVLRRAAAYELEKASFAEESARLSVLYSVSPQIVALLRDKLPGQCEALLQASFSQPRLCLRVNTLRTEIGAVEKECAEAGWETQRGQVPGSLYVDAKGDVTRTRLFKEGLVHVQGEASQLACAALAPHPGDTVLDLCAAPGGKSVTLAQYMNNQGALISCDAVKSRLSLIETALQRTGITCATVHHNDASVYNPSLAGTRDGKADAVLCDVPCSGLGVLAKKPDIRYKTLEGLPELIALQKRILDTAARYVRPGAALVYSTCTVNPDENEGVVRAFLAVHPDFTAVLPAHLPTGAQLRENFVTLYPSEGCADGFFVALLKKAKD